MTRRHARAPASADPTQHELLYDDIHSEVGECFNDLDKAKVIQFESELSNLDRDQRFPICVRKEIELRDEQRSMAAYVKEMKGVMGRHCQEYKEKPPSDVYLKLIEKAFPPGDRDRVSIECLRMMRTAETTWTMKRVQRYKLHLGSAYHCRNANSAMRNEGDWDVTLERLNPIRFARFQSQAPNSTNNAITTSDFKHLSDWKNESLLIWVDGRRQQINQGPISLDEFPGYYIDEDGLIMRREGSALAGNSMSVAPEISSPQDTRHGTRSTSEDLRPNASTPLISKRRRPPQNDPGTLSSETDTNDESSCESESPEPEPPPPKRRSTKATGGGPAHLSGQLQTRGPSRELRVPVRSAGGVSTTAMTAVPRYNLASLAVTATATGPSKPARIPAGAVVQKIWEDAKGIIRDRVAELLPVMQKREKAFQEPLRLLRGGITFVDAMVVEPDVDVEALHIPQDKVCLVTTAEQLRLMFRYAHRCIQDSNFKFVVVVDPNHPPEADRDFVDIFRFCLNNYPQRRIEVLGQGTNTSITIETLLRRMEGMFDKRCSTNTAPARLLGRNDVDSAYKDAQFSNQARRPPERTLRELDDSFWNILGIDVSILSPLQRDYPPANLFDMPRFAIINTIIDFRKYIFILCGELLSWSGYHLDRMNGTWVEVLVGLKAWFVYGGSVGEKEMAELKREGVTWKPEIGQNGVQLIPLIPGMSLFMLAGELCVHAVLGLADTILRGTMFWDIYKLDKLLENLLYIFDGSNTTNEQIPNDMPRILDEVRGGLKDSLQEFLPAELRDRLAEVVERLDSLEKLVRARICCDCEEGRCRNCECRSPKGIDKSPGCTKWCHGGLPCKEVNS